MPVLSVRTFAPLMQQRCKLARTTGYDANGDPTYGPDVVYQCAVIGEMKKVLNNAGEEVLSRQSSILMSNVGFTPEDRITLSTTDVASTESWALQPPIIAVSRYPFLRGQFVTQIHMK